MGSELIDVVVRPADPGDLSFVMDTWLRSFYPTLQRQERKSDFYGFQRLLVTKLLQDSVVLVLHPATDRHLIIGWIAFTADLDLHFLYVRQRYRGLGFARRLFSHVAADGKGQTVYATHLTPDGAAWKAKFSNTEIHYVPQLLALGNIHAVHSN